MNKILIIDDEPPVRKLLKLLLEKNNYTVLEAENGKKGIEQFKAGGADLVITDLLMPEKEGLETIKELKQIQSDLPVIAMSGGGVVNPDLYLNLARKFGVSHALEKPIKTDLLLSIVKELLAPS